MTIINTNPDRPIQLGYEGEDKVTVLRFRYGKDWLENGEGVFHIRVRRHGEHTAYNAQLVADDAENNCLLMTVTNVELSVKGAGEMQVVYSGADFVKKSPIYSYNVSRAVDEVADPPAQDVYTEIIESLSDLQTDVRQISSDVADLSELTMAKIGDLTELSTTVKTDLVSAINEANTKDVEITIDSALSDTSENLVRNKTITGAIREVSSYARDLSGVIDGLGEDVEGLETALKTKADTQTVSALSDAVNGLDSDVQGLQTSKADKFYVDTGLAGKASTQIVSDLSDDVSDLQTGLAEKVDDVQIDGASVVSDGVAEIPLAKSTEVGLVKVGTYGIGVNADGGIYINTASSVAIKNGVNNYNPLTPVRQHEATFYGLAKSAGYDEKSSTLPVGTYSEEAEVAIQKMLGIYEAPFELIEDFTLAEAGMPDKKTEPDGTPYNFRQVFVKVIYPANLESAPSGYGLYYFYDEDNNNLLAETGKYTQNTAQMFKHIFLQKNANMTTLMYTRITSVGSYAMLYNKSQGVGVTFGNVSRIRVNGTEPAGTQIQIYAQRAY